MPHMHIGAGKISFVLDNDHGDWLKGISWSATYSAICLHLGIIGNLFEYDFQTFINVIESKTWVTHVWQYCSDHNAKLIPPKTHQLTPL
mmetsp:Transcript_6547/g.10010  ORF Transcript_6547/g.10010 Transcript_6547/m.10010 type:complete len:89 (-) Transcript_6547:217-483(-)